MEEIHRFIIFIRIVVLIFNVKILFQQPSLLACIGALQPHYHHQKDSYYQNFTPPVYAILQCMVDILIHYLKMDFLVWVLNNFSVIFVLSQVLFQLFLNQCLRCSIFSLIPSKLIQQTIIIRSQAEIFQNNIDDGKHHQIHFNLQNQLQIEYVFYTHLLFFNKSKFDNFIEDLVTMRSTFCLNSVTSARQINLSPLNKSSSKQLYAFSKDSRFKNQTVYCHSFYNISSSLKKPGAGMGYGKKSDFTNDLTSSPGVSKYNLKTIFDLNQTSRKGFTMYESRDKIPDKGHIPLDPLKVPGPTKYDNLKLSRGPTFSMRKKLATLDRTMSIQPQNTNPGAGKYQNPEAMSPKGKYSMSKHKGTGATLFNPKRSPRFFEFKNANPGPGDYEEINNLSDRGYYTVTKSHGFGKRYFDKQKRVVQFEHKAKKNEIPGPGAYRFPSDFGHYDGNVYEKTGGMSFINGNMTSRKASKVKL